MSRIRPPRMLAVFLAVLFAGTAALVAPPDLVTAQTFTDIGNSPFQEEIEWLAEEGITNGCTTDRFCPRDVVRREHMASFLVRMFGYTEEPAEDPFDDDDGSIHEENINRLYAAGVTLGCGGGNYCPKAPVLREQMATFLIRALELRYGAGIDYFTDDDRSEHEQDLDRLYFAGVTMGCGTERVCPRDPVLREQMAAFLFRAVHADPIGPAGFAEVANHSPALTVTFDGPARFRGVTFTDDGATASDSGSYGTISATTGGADQTALVNGVRFAHMASGPLAGSWVKVDETLTTARGRTPRPPACSYQDVLTSRRSYDQWRTTLLDTIYMLPSSYAPGDLVSTANAGLNGGYSVRSLVISDLAAMASQARAAGAPLQVVSAYRSYAQQEATFNYWVSVSGYEQALRTSARPGHSEHQLGTTIDFTSQGGAPPWEYADWANTAAGAWMAENAWRYGFVMSYPRNSFSVACYSYEPWHYRYVGRETAAAVRESGMTLREAIWAAHGP